MPHPTFPIKHTAKFVVMGRSECGKSTVARYLQSHFPRLIIFDTLHEYNEGVIVWTLQQFWAVAKQLEFAERFKIVFRLNPTEMNAEDDFRLALQTIYDWGNCMVVLEEIQELTTPHHMPPILKSLILTGRHQDIALLFTTQRPGECHKTIVSGCGHILTGQLHDRNDVSYVAGFLGRDAKTLVHLPERQFLYFRPGHPIIKVELDGNAFRILPDESPSSHLTRRNENEGPSHAVQADAPDSDRSRGRVGVLSREDLRTDRSRESEAVTDLDS